MAQQIKRDLFERDSLHTPRTACPNNKATQTCSLLKGQSLLWFCQDLVLRSDRRTGRLSLPNRLQDGVINSDRLLVLCVSILLWSQVGAGVVKAQTTPRGMSSEVAQQPAATPQESNIAAAKRLIQEGGQLFQQGTPQSQRQAIEKYQEALQLLKAVGDSPNGDSLAARSQEANALYGMGTTYSILGEHQKALDALNQALSLRRTLKQPREEARVLWSIAEVYKDLGENQKALDYYNQTVTLSRSIGDRSQEAYALSSIGLVYFDLSEYQKSLDALNQALAIRRATKDHSQEANTLQRIGMIYNYIGENQKALDVFNQALPLLEGEENRGVKALILGNIGTIYSSIGENQKALDYYNQALYLYKAEGNRAGEASTLYALGGIYMLSEQRKALDLYNQALILARAIGNRTLEGHILSDIGLVYQELGENQQALDSHNQARLIFREVKDRSTEAFMLNNIARVYQVLGENQQALDAYNQALLLQQQVGDTDGAAGTFRYIASVYSSLGNYQKSLDSYNQALSLYRTMKNRHREAQTLDSIAGIYRLQEDYDKALDFSNQGLSLYRTMGDRLGQTSTLTTIARIYQSKGDQQQVLNTATQLVTQGRDWGDSLSEASGLRFMGEVYRNLGDYQKALDSLNQALSLSRRAIGWSKSEAKILGNIGTVYEASEQPQKAVDVYKRALSLYRTMGDRAQEAETLYSLAGVERKRGNLDEAKKQAEALIDIVESLRGKILSQELRTSYFASVQKYYRFYIDLLMQLHKINPSKGYDALALYASERARARGLLELLTEAHTDIRQGVDPKLLEQERTTQQQLNAAEQRRSQLLSSQYTNKQLDEIKQQVEALRTQLEQVQAQIRKTSPRYASLKYPQPLTLKQIQSTVLDDDTLLLEYSLGEERSYLWAVTKTGITSYELPKRADIEAAAQSFYEQTGKQKLPERRGVGVVPRTDTVEVTTQLSQMLLSPIASVLGQKRLLIVSDSALQYLPFAALPAPDSIGNGNNPVPLIVKHEIVNLPSASTLAVIRQETNGRKPAPKAVAVLADPVFSADDERLKSVMGQASRLPGGGDGQDAHSTKQDSDLAELALTRAAREINVTFNRLPHTRTEANNILKLASAAEEMPAFDFAASRATATNPQLSQYRIVHFATHGILDSQNPELSGVVLSLVNEKGKSQNGFLRLNEIFNLNLPAELVVLSACETGLGQEVKGEGLVGLTRGFMYAGAPRVLVSLWSVDDEGTSELMSRFYKKMLQEKLQPAAALRAAQIEMLQNPQWKEPYYWAPFTLQGEWK